MKRLFCATGNAGKLREIQGMAEGVLRIEPIPGFRDIPSCVEDGATFEENAVLKAKYYGAYVEGPVFADDSGLEVDALDGAPGVFSARYSGEGATDELNNRLLLENLRSVRNRTARFVCRIALIDRGEVLGVYSGSVEGVILDAPRGAGGFGYDPLFYYAPFGCTFGEASEERKSSVSHRGQAFRAMLQAIHG